MNVKYYNFDNWHIPQNYAEASGRGEKHWLQNNDVLGLFKYPKTIHTFEHVSEHIASNIGKKLKIPCADVDIGTYNGRQGCLSHLVTKPNEILCEGINFLQIQYNDYNELTLQCSDGKRYSFEMIWNSLVNNYVRKSFLDVPIFDFIIGNSDRHHNNWAVLIDTDFNFRLSPLYDNGSSLCSYVLEEDIDSYYQDKNRFIALVTSKSRSCISINGNKKPRHYDVIKYLLDNKYFTSDYITDLILPLTNDAIKELIYSYNEVISEKRIKLLTDFLRSKIHILSLICQNKEVDFREEIGNLLAMS